MESVKKLSLNYSYFMAKFKHILLFTLSLSLLLNLVLFLRIPRHTTHNIVHTYSEGTFAEMHAENIDIKNLLPTVQRRTKSTFEGKCHERSSI